MKISSWNVNSVRARIENIKDYLNKFSPNILLMQEIKTEEKNPPLILIVDSYCCLPKPHNFIKQEDIGGYIGGRDTSIDFLQVMNQVFCGQNPVIIGKTSLRDKIWKRIRS